MSMIRKFKLGLFVSVIALLFPLCVKADEFSIVVNCEHVGFGDCSGSNNIYELRVGETARFTITVNGTGVGSFSGGVTLSDKLTGLTNFNPNTAYWADMTQVGGNNGYENGLIGLMKKATGAAGDPKFSFDVTAGDTTGEASVTISSVSILNSQNQSVSMPNIVLNMNITEGTSNTGNNQNTNNGENTNTNTNNGENTNTNANNGENTNSGTASKTDEKKTSDTTKNPGTGVTVSVLGICTAIIGAVSYVILRKKNYFNRI